MNEVIFFLVSALQITLLDLVLSGDNVGVIALAIRNLPPKQAKTASIVGVCGAVGLRILFASIITTFMMIEWLPIKLIGGLLLIKITWDLMTSKEEEEQHNTKTHSGFWKAVSSIIIADISMSLDNVLAIGGAAHGSIGLVVFGLLLNIPIIFFGSQLVARLMTRYKITVFIGAAILMHTSVGMIFEDKLISSHLNHVFSVIFPWIMAIGVLMYGFYIVRKESVSVEV